MSIVLLAALLFVVVKGLSRRANAGADIVSRLSSLTHSGLLLSKSAMVRKILSW